MAAAFSDVSDIFAEDLSFLPTFLDDDVLDEEFQTENVEDVATVCLSSL